MDLNTKALWNNSKYSGLVLYDFNLVLPNKDVFFKFLIPFNEDRRIMHEPEFYPIVEFDDDEGTLFISGDGDDDEMLFYITGETNPITGNFHVHHDFYDYTSDAKGYEYVEYLCRKFKGTLVGVYVKPEGLFPIKIINGERIETKIALLDAEGE